MHYREILIAIEQDAKTGEPVGGFVLVAPNCIEYRRILVAGMIGYSFNLN